MMPPVARRRESGFALLIVFLMAASVALMLYMQMPRVGFESMRDKEDLLIQRGEQYKRGIQLYFIAFKKYPSKIEDLENTNNKRFLRRRYVDPMTGKDEWRIVHVNGAGLLTDSLVQKMPSPTDDKSKTDNASNTGASGTQTAPEVNAAVLQRGSDKQMVPGPGGNQPQQVDPNTGQPIQTGQVYNGQQIGGTQLQGQVPPNQLLLPGQTPGQQFAGQGPNGGLPGNFVPGLPGQTIPGTTGVLMPGQQVGPNGQIVNPNGQGQPITAQNQGQLGQQPSQGVVPNQAINMINTMLTQPGQRPAAAQASTPNFTGGGLGIAGVASTMNGPSIKLYKERGRYNEWEFIYDLKQNTMPGQQPIQNNDPNNPNGGRNGGRNTDRNNPGGGRPPRQ